MPKPKDPTPKTKVNFWVPDEILSELERHKYPGESKTAFYVRIFQEYRDLKAGAESLEDRLARVEKKLGVKSKKA